MEPNPLVSFLKLIRFPNAFSVVTNGLTAAILFGGEWNDVGLAALLLSSVCFYFAGIVDNDLVDLGADSKARPERVLPAGKISVATAQRARILFIVVALIACAATTVITVFVAGLLLLFLIWFYNHVAKHRWYGSVVMAACRVANIYMIAVYLLPWETAATGWLASPHLYPVGLGIYIGGVTLFAENEESVSDRRHLLAATSVILIGLVFLLIPGVADADDNRSRLFNSIVFALLLFPVGRTALTALFVPSSRNVQTVVGNALRSIIVLDAFLCFCHSQDYRWMIIVALAVPAYVLGQWIRST